MTRVVVLVSGKSVRRYPLPDDMELKDHYTIDGRTWTVTDFLTTHKATDQ